MTIANFYLLCYDRQAKCANIYLIDRTKNPEFQFARSQSWSNTWTALASGPFGPSRDRPILLCYDRPERQAQFYYVDAGSSFIAVPYHAGPREENREPSLPVASGVLQEKGGVPYPFPTNLWDQMISVGDLLLASNPLTDAGAQFYFTRAGGEDFLSVYHGASITGVKGWQIVPLTYPSGKAGMLLSNQSGQVVFYAVLDDRGTIKLIKSYNDLGAGWDLLTSFSILGSSFLLSYQRQASAGSAILYALTNDEAAIQRVNAYPWANDVSAILAVPTKYGDAEVISYSPSTATLTVDTLQRDGTLTPLLRQGNLSSSWDLIVPAYHLS